MEKQPRLAPWIFLFFFIFVLTIGVFSWKYLPHSAVARIDFSEESNQRDTKPRTVASTIGSCPSKQIERVETAHGTIPQELGELPDDLIESSERIETPSISTSLFPEGTRSFPSISNSTFEGKMVSAEETISEPPASPNENRPRGAVRIANLPATTTRLPELSKPDLNSLLQGKESSGPSLSPRGLSEDSPSKMSKANWYQPTTLLAMLNDLMKTPSTADWANEAKTLIQQLGPAFARDSNDALRITEQLTALVRKIPAETDRLAASAQRSLLYAQKVEDWATIRLLRKAGYAIERRLDIWRGIAQLGPEFLSDSEFVSGDPRRLSLCMAQIESMVPGTPEGQHWREYLLLDVLKGSHQEESFREAERKREVAKQILERVDQTPMSGRQRQFINQPQIVAFRNELHRWAADPVSPADILKTVERYEQSGRNSDARQLAQELQSLAVSPNENRRELVKRIDAYYRNANLRVAVSEKILNRLIPPSNMEYAPVNDTLLGVPVHGKSLTSADLAIRMVPNSTRARMALEVTGEVASTTSSTAGPATFYNDSEAVYGASKMVEITPQGIRLMPAEVDVRHQTRLRNVTTDFQGIPLVGSIAKRVAQTQHELFQGSANDEAQRKVAAKARERIDNEALDRFTEMVNQLNQNLFGPLVNLSLEPTILDSQTTKDRLTMRLRVAGSDQLGSHTPRPQAPADSLASFQIHESMLNNAAQRLQLEGKTFTLKQLAERISERFQRSLAWQVSPDHEDVLITFAEKDALLVQCREGQVILMLSVAELSKAPRRWNDFQVKVFYKPEINGRNAELAREGVIHLISNGMSLGSQIALRGICNKAFPSSQRVNLMPARFLNDANLKDLHVSQFAIDDGWIGVAIGDKPQEVRTTRMPWRETTR